MAKGYPSKKQAYRIRAEACQLAVEQGADNPADLMAYCVFFESYIGNGSKWTEKHMRLMGQPPGTVLKLIPGGKA